MEYVHWRWWESCHWTWFHIQHHCTVGLSCCPFSSVLFSFLEKAQQLILIFSKLDGYGRNTQDSASTKDPSNPLLFPAPSGWTLLSFSSEPHCSSSYLLLNWLLIPVYQHMSKYSPNRICSGKDFQTVAKPRQNKRNLNLTSLSFPMQMILSFSFMKIWGAFWSLWNCVPYEMLC